MVVKPWEAASNGSGKMRWFVCRSRDPGDGREYLWESRGRPWLRRFTSREAAQRAADFANQKESVK